MYAQRRSPPQRVVALTLDYLMTGRILRVLLRMRMHGNVLTTIDNAVLLHLFSVGCCLRLIDPRRLMPIIPWDQTELHEGVGELRHPTVAV